MTSPYLVLDARVDGGAPGDGSDVTRELQALIDGAPVGSAIYFPPGIYEVGDLFVGPRFDEEVFVGGGFGGEAGFGGVGAGGFGGGEAGAEGVGWVVPGAPPGGLTFFGDGHLSVLRRRKDAERIATINEGRDITFRSLGFDANGIGEDGWGAYGGGLFFHACSRVRVHDTYSYDSDFHHPDVQPELRFVHDGDFEDDIREQLLVDRNAFFFARSSHVWVAGNLVEGQQVSFAGCRYVTVAGNTFVNPIFRAIHVGGHQSPKRSVRDTPEEYRIFSGVLDADYQIVDNVIENPWTHGVHCGSGPFVESARDEGNELRRIRIAGNLIRKRASLTRLPGYREAWPDPADERKRSRTYGCGILVGVGRLGVYHEGPNRYRDIVVEANEISLENPLHRSSHGICFNPPRPGGEGGDSAQPRRIHRFLRVVIRDNQVRGTGSVGTRWNSWGIRTQGLRDSVVGGNGVYRFTHGISVSTHMLLNHVYANRVEVTSLAYQFIGSEGANSLVNNAILGDVDDEYRLDLRGSDVLMRVEPRVECEDEGIDPDPEWLPPWEWFWWA